MSALIFVLTQPVVVAWLLKATLLLIAALAATSLLRRASAGTRHLVWLATLAGILLLPAVSFWTPVRLAIVPAILLPSLPQASAPARLTAPPTVPVDVKSATAVAPAPVVPHEALVTEPALPNGRFPFWTTIFALWGAVAAGLLGWLSFGALSVRRIVKSGHSLDDRAWQAPLCEIADRLDLDAVPRLLSSPLVEMPFACGVVQPTIVLPASAEQWNDSRRRAVLFHELAHVKRRDLVGHTLGRVTCALYWFHPLVWTAGRRLRAESERACDDLVLSCGARASDYADHLLDIVISVRHHGAPATAMPMARRRELEGRVLAILDPAVARIGPGRIQSATLLVGLGALALSVAAMAPRTERETKSGTAQLPQHNTVADVAAQPSNGVTTQNQRSRALQNESHGAQQAPTPTPSPVTSPTPLPVPSPAPDPQSAQLTHGLGDALGKITAYGVREAAAAISAAAKVGQGGQAKQGVDSAKVALLLRVLRSDPNAEVRRMAAWGLSDAGDMPAVVEALAEALRTDDEETVREMAAWALSDSRRETARRALVSALRRDASDQVRESAVWALANAGLRDDRDVIEAALTSDPSDEVRETAAWALGNSPQRPAARALVTALGDKSPEVRESAAWALAETEDDDTAPGVSAAFMRETNANVRMAELRALIFMHVDDKAILDAALSSKDAELRARAVRMLAGSSGAWPEPRPRPRPRPMP